MSFATLIMSMTLMFQSSTDTPVVTTVPARSWHQAQLNKQVILLYGWRGEDGLIHHTYTENQHIYGNASIQVAPINSTPIQTVSYTPIEVVNSAPIQVATNPAIPTQYGDPYGFTAWLNQTRASYGLGPVGHDSNLANWASQNNSQQRYRGLGHYIMGPSRRQNAAGYIYDIVGVGTGWMNSPGHRAMMLDPSLTMIGIAFDGIYWTMNGY